MRIALALSLLAGAVFLTPAAATAAPLALSDHTALTKSVGEAGAVVEEAGWRHKSRRYGRRYGCNWTCYPYYRPYQYHYWQFYYPYGGPLF
ncbi:MAG: hypothetical protein ACRECX_04785 [Methyloceanibacter sp.]|uniref:hypothetical protein n=1 Tax=Methyloceanibacter sp. TaxID=1965321 RepID=UPI003D6CB5BA